MYQWNDYEHEEAWSGPWIQWLLTGSVFTPMCGEATTVDFHPTTVDNSRCVCHMSTNISRVPKQPRHKHLCQLSLPLLILTLWGSGAYVRNPLIPSHRHLPQSTTSAPNISSPPHYSHISAKGKHLLATLEGTEELWEVDGQAVPTSFWLTYEDVPGCSPGNRRDREMSPWIFFRSYDHRLLHKQNLQIESCFVPAYTRMRGRE